MLGATFRQYAASGASILSVAMCAMGFVFLEPLMKRLVSENSEIPMTTQDTSWLVAFVEIGEVVSTIPSGLLSDRYGRRPILLYSGPIALSAWILVLTTRSILAMYVVRFLQGVVIAMVHTAGPMYVAEISEARIRGELSGHFQTLWFAGILIIYVIGPLFDYQNYIYICAIGPVIFMLAFVFMPESPYYYLMVGKHEKALKSLKWLRASDDVNLEFDMMRQTVEREMSGKGSWTDLFATRHDTKMFLVVILVCAVRYLNGMSAVTSYATESLKGSTIDSHTLTISLGVIMCITTTCSAFIVDSVGRRALLLWSAFGSVLCNITLGGYYYFYDLTTFDVKSYSWIMLTAMGGLCIASNVGLAPLLQTVQAEYFPTNTRGIGGGITEMTAAAVTFVTLKQFQMLTDAFGVFANFWVFAACSIVGYILFYFFIPETAGKTLGEIQNITSKTKTPKEEIMTATVEKGEESEHTVSSKL